MQFQLAVVRTRHGPFWAQKKMMDSERDATPVNVALGLNPGGLDFPAPLAKPYANETAARPRASTAFMVPRPTPITHTQTRLRLDRVF